MCLHFPGQKVSPSGSPVSKQVWEGRGDPMEHPMNSLLPPPEPHAFVLPNSKASLYFCVTGYKPI